jgi:hypothetical protein
LPRLGCGDERTGVRSGNHAGIGNPAGLLQQWLVC